MSIEPMDARADKRVFAHARPGFAFWAGLVVLLAFLVREYFVLVATVAIPIRGDIREYVVYAWNLYNHGVFSLTEPGTSAPVPDAYRSPGYPWLLVFCMWLRSGGDGWYVLALQIQVLLGTATVWLTMLVGRRWLSLGWTITAGLLLAIWPHHVAATGALLSEVLFGFTLMAGLYALAIGFGQHKVSLFVAAGIVFGLAYLINPLIAFFPFVIAPLVLRNGRRAAALALIGVFLVPVVAFAVRNHALTGAEQRANRAAVNFVQGSWPQYHDAWQGMLKHDPISISIIAAINAETKALDQQPDIGLHMVGQRIVDDPIYYASWYLLHKPLSLWDWNIQVGRGGIYFLIVDNSPLETHPLLRASTNVLRQLNPLCTLLAFAGTLLVLVGASRKASWASPGAEATAFLFLYLTAVHTVFQAEPRYAIAYRGMEILLVVTCLQVVSMTWLARARFQNLPHNVTLNSGG